MTLECWLTQRFASALTPSSYLKNVDHDHVLYLPFVLSDCVPRHHHPPPPSKPFSLISLPLERTSLTALSSIQLNRLYWSDTWHVWPKHNYSYERQWNDIHSVPQLLAHVFVPFPFLYSQCNVNVMPLSRWSTDLSHCGFTCTFNSSEHMWKCDYRLAICTPFPSHL